MADRRRNAPTPPNNHDPFRHYVTKALERLVALGELDAHWRQEQERRWEEERRRWQARCEVEDKRWEYQFAALGSIGASINQVALAVDELRKRIHEDHTESRKEHAESRKDHTESRKDHTEIAEAFSANTAALRELLAELLRRRGQTSSGGDGSGGSPAA